MLFFIWINLRHFLPKYYRKQQNEPEGHNAQGGDSVEIHDFSQGKPFADFICQQHLYEINAQNYA